MAVLINKKGEKYRLMGTWNDRYFTDWISREEAVVILVERANKRHREEIKNLKETFPKGFCGTNRKIFI